jgi:hypothetical protein
VVTVANGNSRSADTYRFPERRRNCVVIHLNGWHVPVVTRTPRLAFLAVAATLACSLQYPAASQNRKSAKPGALPLSSARAYAESVADVDCANVVQRHTGVRDLDPVLRAIVQREGSQIVKDEFETSPAFEQRSATHYEQLFGGTSKLVLVRKMDPVFYTVKYDADRGVMQIGRPFEPDIYNNGRGGASGEHSLQLFRDTLATKTYEASNAYGATTEVESSTKMRAALLFPTSQIPPLPGREYAPIEVPMGTETARKFKANPLMLVVARLRPPYLVQAYDRSKATIDWPYETRLTSYGLKVDMQCIVFASGSDEIYRITFQP